MSLKDEILQTLLNNANDYVSGQDLAKQSNKSRAAVWKAINSLRKEGFSINAITNKGYILTNENDLINPEIIKSKLKNNIEVIYYPTIDSTNNEAKRLVMNGKNDVMLITADEQTSGRGRQGKSFYSPKLTGIYMSVIVHPRKELQNAVTITTATGVAVCKAIERLTDKKPKIKWVNDVYLDGKKICGTLTEAITDFESGEVTCVIIGVGMNIKTFDFPSDAPNASSLNCEVKRADLISAICDEILSIIDGDYKTFIDYYRSHSMIIGEEINFIENGKVTPAFVKAIDDMGGLVVKLNDGTQKILRSGEISIRKR